MIRVLGNDVELRATVEIINGYSAHADRTELTAWLTTVQRTSPNLRTVCLVHGEEDAQAALSGALRTQGFSVTCPALRDRLRT